MTRQTTPEQRADLSVRVRPGGPTDVLTRAVLADLEAAEAEVAMLREAAQCLIDGVKASRYTIHPCIICMIDLDHAPHFPGCAYVKAQEILAATADSDEWVKEEHSEPGE